MANFLAKVLCVLSSFPTNLASVLRPNQYHILIASISVLLLLGACSTSKPLSTDLVRLGTMMEGSFSSQEQHNSDTANYFDIRLHIVRIWQDRTDGYWLYVEQAIARAQDRPYRQRVYRVTKLSEKKFESAVYTFDSPLRFAGSWKNPSSFSSLTPDSLTPRTGCSVYLTETAEGYEGSTKESDCPSDLRGAKYATSEVRITSDKMVSWDRGFDERNEQIWGATQGGYQFIKQK